MTVRTLLIGAAERAEFAPILAWRETRIEPPHRHSCLTIAAAVKLLRTQPVDLIIVLESQPDEYLPADIDALFAAAPLGRIVCCAGVWSESAGRTRRMWPVALCVPAIAAVARLEREYRLLTEPKLDFWLPPTGDRLESFAANHPAIAPRANPSPMTVRIISPDADYRAMLTDLLRLSNVTVATANEVTVDAILWDADPWSSSRSTEVATLSGTAPVIALSGWITPEMEVELLNMGVQTVLPKLADHNRLLDALLNSTCHDLSASRVFVPAFGSQKHTA